MPDSPATRDRAAEVVRGFLLRAKKDHEAPEPTALFADGLELDSLETAELSALLEDEFGRDPFSEGDDMPETLAAVLDYYAADARDAADADRVDTSAAASG